MRLANERELVVKLKEGEASAFAALYQAYSGVLYSFLVKLGIQNEDSKDVIQQAFIKLWEHRESLNESLSLQSYLITIAKNDIYNRVKRRMVEQKYQSTVHITEEQVLPTSEIHDLLHHILLELPGKRREVFTMSRIEGYSNKEIAEKLNITKSTVENHINHSTRQIKAFLKKIGLR